MIVLVRADERLIHGQTMQFIVPEYKIDKILLVDDATASNSILVSIFKNTIPSRIDMDIVNTVDANVYINNLIEDTSNGLLLVRHPRVFRDLLNINNKLPLKLNIGSQMAKKGKKYTDYATLSDEDEKACKDMNDKGVEIYFNSIGSNGVVTPWK